jgi:hypothetical protein
MKKFIYCLFGIFLFLDSFAQLENISFMEFEYQNKLCSGFKYGNGTLIFVPSDAFCFADGSSCQGKIKIKYREFHSQTDMLVANLNMLLNRGGKQYILESAGMFEVRAECDGKPMVLCEGKSIQVRMKCRRDLNNLEGFKYNESINRWEDCCKVYDFSYDSTAKTNDMKLWGTGAMDNSAEVYGIDVEGNEFVDIKKMLGELPQGFFKGMNISSLGIYNYDKVIDDNLAIPMIPEFTVNTGDAIGESVFVAYENRNTLINYTQSDFAERFVLLNTKGIKIFSKLKDGSYATLKEGSLDKMNIKLMQNTKQSFILEKQPLKPKNKAELAKVTKISNS